MINPGFLVIARANNVGALFQLLGYKFASSPSAALQGMVLLT